MTPYYEHAGITLWHGDAREILPQIEHPDTCIVDPVWPNSVFTDIASPGELFKEICAELKTERVVVHLGCASDPRFLLGVPASYPFLRTCWLRYARPAYRGRILVGSDVAYAFGTPPPSREGRHVLSGEYVARNNGRKTQGVGKGEGQASAEQYLQLPHPCPRRIEHVEFLVSVFADKGVLDPCAGTGTTLEAAKTFGLSGVGIEPEERYCEIAAKRLSQEVFDFSPSSSSDDPPAPQSASRRA